MAESIAWTPPGVESQSPTGRDLERLLEALSQHGILEALTALIEESPTLLKIFLDTAEEPQNLEALQALTGVVTGFFAHVGPTREVIQEEMGKLRRDPEASEPLGLWGLMRLLKDPEISRALRIGFGVLKALGKVSR